MGTHVCLVDRCGERGIVQVHYLQTSEVLGVELELSRFIDWLGPTGGRVQRRKSMSYFVLQELKSCMSVPPRVQLIGGNSSLHVPATCLDRALVEVGVDTACWGIHALDLLCSPCKYVSARCKLDSRDVTPSNSEAEKSTAASISSFAGHARTA